MPFVLFSFIIRIVHVTAMHSGLFPVPVGVETAESPL